MSIPFPSITYPPPYAIDVNYQDLIIAAPPAITGVTNYPVLPDGTSIPPSDFESSTESVSPLELIT